LTNLRYKIAGDLNTPELYTKHLNDTTINNDKPGFISLSSSNPDAFPKLAHDYIEGLIEAFMANV
jgi:hypothetical protein